jgi:hypothetical protein
MARGKGAAETQRPVVLDGPASPQDQALERRRCGFVRVDRIVQIGGSIAASGSWRANTNLG